MSAGCPCTAAFLTSLQQQRSFRKPPNPPGKFHTCLQRAADGSAPPPRGQPTPGTTSSQHQGPGGPGRAARRPAPPEQRGDSLAPLCGTAPDGCGGDKGGGGAEPRPGGAHGGWEGARKVAAGSASDPARRPWGRGRAPRDPSPHPPPPALPPTLTCARPGSARRRRAAAARPGPTPA